MAINMYADKGVIRCHNYTEIYVPEYYFTLNLATNIGISIETFGLVYIKEFSTEDPPLRFVNIPAIVNFMIYDTDTKTLNIKGTDVPVRVLKYPTDSEIMSQSIKQGREVGEAFVTMVLKGKLPHTLNYPMIIDMYWRTLEIGGLNYQIPSKLFEMILAMIYRDPTNKKNRYGEVYGSSETATGYDYTSDNVRNIVKEISTFSGMAFEDIGKMITSGINNSNDGIEEYESPLEKIMYY